MSLGLFSVSLAVKDIAASKKFYQTLGFEVVFGEEDQNWLILDNGDVKIGLFQGMFEKNTLTFNPGWGLGAQPVDVFEDVRDIQKRLKAAGVEIMDEVDADSGGPGNMIVLDPDGNPVLFDQHV